MELDDFVHETIVQIVKGVTSAQKDTEDQDANINPTNVRYLSEGHWNQLKGAAVQHVEFDVALTESEGSGKQGGIGVFFGGVGLGTKGQKDSQSISVTKVRFSVPIVFPPGREQVSD